ncbi:MULTISPECIES: response regulator [unclassified Lysobacter]|uniref:response regulator n=1 Tax=unclassified Lysobacter TaxID=2635362 RepID=UPI001C244C5D|nr:response regulator [Lysobacter sp. MMG2]MBU8975205.1 response regulator [Lysobacter sp. MMG2]
MAEHDVLLVEDEDDLRMLVGEALRLTGYRVTLAADGPQAVAALEQGRFDVVVSDVSMPGGMSGIDLTTHAARLQPDARIILVSGFARAQLPALPANVGFLPKPYRIPQLLELLREHVPSCEPALARVPG